MLSYDDWLSLSDKERDEIHLDYWNTHKREGYPIAFHAASRLALNSGRTILQAWIGTYHGGEYLLEFSVPTVEHANCPKPLSERFEGFRTIWHPDFNMPNPNE